MTEHEFFEAVDGAVAALICKSVDIAKRNSIEPGAFAVAVTTSLIARCFDVLTVMLPPDKARAMIEQNARAAESFATFGRVEGEA